LGPTVVAGDESQIINVGDQIPPFSFAREAVTNFQQLSLRPAEGVRERFESAC
jgi:hypothetical protein